MNESVGFVRLFGGRAETGGIALRPERSVSLKKT